LNLLEEGIMRRESQSQYTLSPTRFKGEERKKGDGLNNREDQGTLTPAIMPGKKQDQML
jgi:hypothetical protein